MPNNLKTSAFSITPLVLLIIGFCSTSFAQCRSPLSEATLRALTLSTGFLTLQVQPGQTVELIIYEKMCCNFVSPVNACAEWSISDDTYAHIDTQSGVLTIKTEERQRLIGGYFFIVTANIENGRKILSTPVYIYKPETNPFIGTWRETRRFSCKSGKAVSTTDPIVELVLRADGKMYATSIAFETYFDFWGKYIFDVQRGEFGFAIDDGNRIPDDVDGLGQFRLEADGKLILKKLSLGSFNQGDKRTCKYEFEKTRNGDPF